jgi:hypothetical protein
LVHLSSGQHSPPPDPSSLPDHIDPSRAFNEALPRAELHPLHILSRYTSLFYFNHPPTAIGRFPAYRLSPRLATSALDTYINPDPSCLAHSSLMMEAVRTSETSVDNHFTRQYIPEDNSEHRGLVILFRPCHGSGG